tara:strand:- start:106 stop:411 length:306 start_codon:yes stop_codon:yes gene_type:complete
MLFEDFQKFFTHVTICEFFDKNNVTSKHFSQSKKYNRIQIKPEKTSAYQLYIAIPYNKEKDHENENENKDHHVHSKNELKSFRMVLYDENGDYINGSWGQD